MSSIQFYGIDGAGDAQINLTELAGSGRLDPRGGLEIELAENLHLRVIPVEDGPFGG